MLVVLAVTYNSLIAILGANGSAVNATTVMIVEAIILAASLLAIVQVNFQRDDLPSIILFFTFFIVTIYLSIINEFFYPETLRNISIISIFSMLGLRASFSTVKFTIFTVCALVVIFLFIECYSTPLYVEIFQPAHYFEKTRGLEIPDWDKSGLFGNALGFKERFSFGLSDHRTASIFLEQLSLANFAAFLTVFLISLWQRLPIWQRIFYAGVIIAILLTNDTRTSLILAVLAPAGYFVYPRMPRFLNITVAPLLIIIAWIIEDPNRPYADDFAGRLSLTVRTLKGMDLSAALGMNVLDASKFADSGYTYFSYAATLPGMVLLWIFVSLYIPQTTPAQKRYTYASNLFIASSLVVAGTSIFTIKIAGLLWFLAGFMRSQKDQPARPSDSDHSGR